MVNSFIHIPQKIGKQLNLSALTVKLSPNKYDAPDSAFEVRFTDYDHCITEYYTINGNKKK